jgi:hypothetical protein
MADMKVPKLRRTKKEPTRQTDDRAEAFSPHGIGDDERHRMIAEAAYFRALGRGFANGSPESDWLEAEAEVAARLGGSVTAL